MTTATRWWVRAGARWLARIDGVASHLRLAMLVLTGLSTATLTLRQYGHGDLAWPLIGVAMGAMTAYAFVYAEHGVWNQVQRDKADLSDNYAGPTLRIDDEHIARGIVAGIEGRTLDESERAAIKAELDDTFAEYRDGIDDL